MRSKAFRAADQKPAEGEAKKRLRAGGNYPANGDGRGANG
jgi:hypothetical protein